jgi:hypothetical protein
MRRLLTRSVIWLLISTVFIFGLILGAETYVKDSPCVRVGPDADLCLFEHNSGLAEAPP